MKTFLKNKLPGCKKKQQALTNLHEPSSLHNQLEEPVEVKRLLGHYRHPGDGCS